MSASLSSSSFMESNYLLALKYFMSKDFHNSFQILKSQYTNLFLNLLSGVIGEDIFKKVLNLYLTEVGLLLQPGSQFETSRLEKKEIISQLQNDFVLNNLVLYYHDLNKIPSEILYNICLICYIGLDLDIVRQKMTSLYAGITFEGKGTDKYLVKFTELLAIKVLPECDMFSDARNLINENPLFLDKALYLDKVNKIEKNKCLEKEHKDKTRLKQIREQKSKEEKEKLEKDLKYKSLKQIRESSQPISNPKPLSERRQESNLDNLKDKLLYNLNFSKKWIHEHTPLVLLIIAAFFVGNRMFKSKRGNVIQNMKETLKMAFKISYI